MCRRPFPHMAVERVIWVCIKFYGLVNLSNFMFSSFMCKIYKLILYTFLWVFYRDKIWKYCSCQDWIFFLHKSLPQKNLYILISIIDTGGICKVFLILSLWNAGCMGWQDTIVWFILGEIGLSPMIQSNKNNKIM